MAKWQGKTRGGVLGYSIFILILKRFGLPPAYFVLRFVALYFFCFSPKSFKYQYFYFRQIHNCGIIKSIINIYRNYYAFGQTILDKIAVLSGGKSLFTFDFEGEHYLREMKEGGFLISAHIGNWEIAGHLLERLESRFNIVMFDAEHQRIKHYLEDVLSEKKFRVIVIRDDFSHIYEINQALDNNELVCMHGDRFVDCSKTIELDFLGQKAEFPVGPFYLAVRSGKPVSYVFAVKETNSHYHFFACEPQKYVSKELNRNVLIEQAAKDYVLELEKKVRQFPLQWFNYYDFWSFYK